MLRVVPKQMHQDVEEMNAQINKANEEIRRANWKHQHLGDQLLERQSAYF